MPLAHYRFGPANGTFPRFFCSGTIDTPGNFTKGHNLSVYNSANGVQLERRDRGLFQGRYANFLEQQAYHFESGHDTNMLQVKTRGIVVSDYSPELEHLRKKRVCILLLYRWRGVYLMV